MRTLASHPAIVPLTQFWSEPLSPDHPLSLYLEIAKVQKAAKALAVQSLCCWQKLLGHLDLARSIVDLSTLVDRPDDPAWVTTACRAEMIVATLERLVPWFTDELLLVTETFVRSGAVRGTVAPEQLFLQFYCERLVASFEILEDVGDGSEGTEAVEEIFTCGQELLRTKSFTLPTF
jgi:hypothetical protein